jgi:hypothetical protein
VLHGHARALYKKSRAKSVTEHKPLVDSIRASQNLSKDDFDLRMNTRD